MVYIYNTTYYSGILCGYNYNSTLTMEKVNTSGYVYYYYPYYSGLIGYVYYSTMTYNDSV